MTMLKAAARETKPLPKGVLSVWVVMGRFLVVFGINTAIFI